MGGSEFGTEHRHKILKETKQGNTPLGKSESLKGIDSGAPALDKHFRFGKLRFEEGVGYTPVDTTGDTPRYGGFYLGVDTLTRKTALVGISTDGEVIVDKDYKPVTQPVERFLWFEEESVGIRTDEGIARLSLDGIVQVESGERDPDKIVPVERLFVSASLLQRGITGEDMSERANDLLQQGSRPTLAYVAGFRAKAEREDLHTIHSAPVTDSTDHEAILIPKLDPQVAERMQREISQLREQSSTAVPAANRQLLPPTGRTGVIVNSHDFLNGQYYVSSEERPDFYMVYLMTDVINKRYGVVGETVNSERYLVHPFSFQPLTPGVKKFESFGEDHVVARDRDARFAITTGEEVSGNPSGKHRISEKDITDYLDDGVTSRDLLRWAKEELSLHYHGGHNPQLAFTKGFMAKDMIAITNLRPKEAVEEMVIVEATDIGSQTELMDMSPSEKAGATVAMIKAVAGLQVRPEKVLDQIQAVDCLATIAAEQLGEDIGDGVLPEFSVVYDQSSGVVSKEALAHVIAAVEAYNAPTTSQDQQETVSDKEDSLPTLQERVVDFLERNANALLQEEPQESEETNTTFGDAVGRLYNRAAIELGDMHNGTKLTMGVSAFSGGLSGIGALTNSPSPALLYAAGVATVGATAYEVIQRRRENKIIQKAIAEAPRENGAIVNTYED